MSDERLSGARLAVGGSLITLLGFALLLVLLDPLAGGAGLSGWVALAGGLAGLVAPAIGYRLYRNAPREGGFVRAHVRGMRATEVGGFLGLLAWLATDDWTALTGLLTHTLLAGAIWPTPERLESFDAPREDGGP